MLYPARYTKYHGTKGIYVLIPGVRHKENYNMLYVSKPKFKHWKIYG